jgi:hypothetical protein
LVAIDNGVARNKKPPPDGWSAKLRRRRRQSSLPLPIEFAPQDGSN